MLKDFSKLNIERISKLTVTFKPGDCWASYKIPDLGFRRDDWALYLTDAQIVQVRSALGLRTPISSLSITADAIKSRAVVFG
jgi:hypothetical protein